MLFRSGHIDTVLGHHEECECTLKHVKSLYYLVDTRSIAIQAVLTDKMRQNLAVRGRLEKRPSVLQVFAKLVGVHQVAVVGKGEVSRAMPEEEWLYIFDAAATGGGVADMTNCVVSF